MSGPYVALAAYEEGRLSGRREALRADCCDLHRDGIDQTEGPHKIWTCVSCGRLFDDDGNPLTAERCAAALNEKRAGAFEEAEQMFVEWADGVTVNGKLLSEYLAALTAKAKEEKE